MSTRSSIAYFTSEMGTFHFFADCITEGWGIEISTPWGDVDFALPKELVYQLADNLPQNVPPKGAR